MKTELEIMASILQCTLCNDDYFSKAEWNKHLLQSCHQIGASRELGKWGAKERECGIMLYAKESFLLGGLVQETIKLAEKMGGEMLTFVTNLVLFPKVQNRVAIMQLESRDKVHQVLAKIRDLSITINKRLVQLKRLETVLELEWTHILESLLEPDLSSSPTPEVKPHPNIKLEMTVFKYSPKSSPVSKSSSPTSFSSFMKFSTRHTPLQRQWDEIYQSVLILPKEFKMVQQILHEMKQVFHKSFPDCELELYLHAVLGLRNIPDEDILYPVYLRTSKDHRPTSDNVRLKLRGAQKSSSILHQLMFPTLQNSRNSYHYGYYTYGLPILHPQAGIRLAVSTSPRYLHEFQLSRLLCYYLHFDARVKPLLALLYFWARINDTYFTFDKCQSTKLFNCSGLEWLLLFYLHYCKEELVPAPGHILERRHKPVWGTPNGDTGSYDIGFAYDLHFAEEWIREGQCEKMPQEREYNDDFIWDVVELFRKFCAFYGDEVDTNRHCFDLRNGEILTFLHANKLNIRHPLGEKWTLRMDNVKWIKRVRPALKQTASRLAEFRNHLDLKCGKEFSLWDALTVPWI